MNEQEIQPKKSFFRRFWWIGLVIILGLGVTWGIMNFVVHPKESNDGNKGGILSKSDDSNQSNGNEETKQMTDSQIQAANDALAKGVSIDDGQNDWHQFPAGSIQGDGRPDNTSPYPLPYTDIKNVSFGADSNYIYFKFTLWGSLPTTLQSYNGDDVKFFCNNIAIGKYLDSSGNAQVGELQIGTTYIKNLDQDKTTEATTNYSATKPTISLTNMGNQNGRDKNGEATWVIQNGKGIVTGGPGKDYIMAGFPLDNFGLKLRDTIEFSVSYEDASRIYHHQSVDMLLDKSNNKEGDTIQYVMGANTYKNLGFQMETGKN